MLEMTRKILCAGGRNPDGGAKGLAITIPTEVAQEMSLSVRDCVRIRCDGKTIAITKAKKKIVKKEDKMDVQIFRTNEEFFDCPYCGQSNRVHSIRWIDLASGAKRGEREKKDICVHMLECFYRTGNNQGGGCWDVSFLQRDGC